PGAGAGRPCNREGRARRPRRVARQRRHVDHFFLIERHLAPMLEIAESLGDDRVNVLPDLPGANSAYQLVFHSCGMLEWWTRASILGKRVTRDRAAEFTSAGTIASLQARAAQVVAP